MINETTINNEVKDNQSTPQQCSTSVLNFYAAFCQQRNGFEMNSLVLSKCVL